MIDFTTERDMLREFSNYKIFPGQSAIAIYEEIEGKRTDIVVIYTSDGLTQVDKSRYDKIPQANKNKFNDVVVAIREKLKEKKYDKSR